MPAPCALTQRQGQAFVESKLPRGPGQQSASTPTARWRSQRRRCSPCGSFLEHVPTGPADPPSITIILGLDPRNQECRYRKQVSTSESSRPAGAAGWVGVTSDDALCRWEWIPALWSGTTPSATSAGMTGRRRWLRWMQDGDHRHGSWAAALGWVEDRPLARGTAAAARSSRPPQRYVPGSRPGRPHRVRRVLKHPACCVEVPPGLEVAGCASVPAQPAGLLRSSPGFQSRAASGCSSQRYIPWSRPGRPHSVRRVLKHPACFVEAPPGLEVARCAGVPPQPGGLSRSSPRFQSRAAVARSPQRYVPHPRPGRSHRVRRVLKHPACFVEAPPGLDVARCASVPPQPAGLSRSSPGFQSRAAAARSTQPAISILRFVRGS